MLPKGANRELGLMRLAEAGGLQPGVAGRVQRETGVPEADLYGVGTFYHLLAHPDAGTWVCGGLSCKLAGCDRLMDELQAGGRAASWAPCLGRCDIAPATWDPADESPTPVPGLVPSDPERLAIDLAGNDVAEYRALALARERGAEWVIEQLEASGLQGRGGAGFPAHIKWRGVRGQAETERYVVLNADEGEPGTFKDREVLLRRPQRVVEGLAIAAACIGAQEIHCYVRGEFGRARASLERAVEQAGLPESPSWHFADGHGAYICGEETALFEALEGKRGMPRMKPPFPTECGFRGKPTLIQNVETIACVPAILERGAAWFRGLGRTEPGSKLYCLSGHVSRPGVYEAPLGTSAAELIELGGGATGPVKAFSPGGASSGFLPASMLELPLDFKSLQQAGSMLGSAGVVVLDESTDLVRAALVQATFFENESCGQCSPCRIGTQLLRQALQRHVDGGPAALAHVEEVAWGMREASICGLGQAAAAPLVSAMRHFPEEFSR